MSNRRGLLFPGDLFPDASHRVVRLIGRGGIGEVYEVAGAKIAGALQRTLAPPAEKREAG